MKKYTGLKVSVVEFKDDVIKTSLPGGCIQVVANTVVPGGSTCENPETTTGYMYVNNNPFGD